MTTNPFFSGRIPQGLLDRIEEYRQQTNQSKSEILIKALAKYVEYQLEEKAPQIPPIREEFKKIYKRLEALESQLSKKETELPKQLEITDDNEVIISDNKSDYEVLSGKEVIELTGIGKSKLYGDRKKGKLPIIINGFEIDLNNYNSRLWRVKKIDN
ncbi:MAG: hypothetical protein AB4372_32835 [Xenococcus sp. (in: cyanobacteria)]